MGLEKERADPLWADFHFSRFRYCVSSNQLHILSENPRRQKDLFLYSQRVLVRTYSMMKHKLSPSLKLNPAIHASPFSTTSSYDPLLKRFWPNSRKLGLLEWNGDFSGFTWHEESHRSQKEDLKEPDPKQRLKLA